MSWKVLVTAPYLQPVLDRYYPIFHKNEIELIVPPVNERLEEEELLRWVEDVDGVICGDDQFTERVLQSARDLKVLSKWGTGIDSINREACRRLGITVCYTPNAFSASVADSVLGYILSFARQLPWMDRDIRNGYWEKTAAISLCECTLGVIGVGNVGKAVVRRAIAFGMRILGNDPVEMPTIFLHDTGIKMVCRNELLQKADYISINCDLNPTSFHLIGDSEFDLMKSTAVVINTARGSIINETALIEALQEKRIAGAALDVYEIEPLPVDSPLRRMNNVMLAPHNANSSPGAWEKVHRNTIRNLLEVLEGSRISGVIEEKVEEAECLLF